jgi:hypothetical protein
VPEKPEIAPSDDDVAVVRSQVVESLLDDLQRELGHPLDVQIEVVVNGTQVSGLRMRSSGDGRPQSGTVRLRFRPTGDPTRKLFFAEAVFSKDQRRPAFSGFVVRGAVRIGERGRDADYKTWAVKRNNWTWSKWL